MTPKQLKEFFESIKAKQERKKKVLESKKQKQLDNLKRNEEKALRRAENEQYVLNRIVHIYHSRWTDRFQADDEVYGTREELKMAEGRREGAINWDVWDKLVNETRKLWQDKNLQRLRGKLGKQNT